MGSPYLNHGETIVLTTGNVAVDGVLYDIMLTTERLIFIDNRNPRFEPVMVPLSPILSVQGGRTPAHHPVITLIFRPGEDGGEARQPLNMIFSQNPNENRKPERDDWVRKLIQVSIALRERESSAAGTVPAPERSVTGGDLQPAIRRWVAPDRVLPLSNVGTREPVSEPVPVQPEPVEGGGEILPAGGALRATGEDRIAAPEPSSGRQQDLSPVSAESDGTPLVRQPAHTAPRLRGTIPRIVEETLPEKTIPEPPPMTPEDHTEEVTLSDSIGNVIRSFNAEKAGSTGYSSPEPGAGNVPEISPTHAPAEPAGPERSDGTVESAPVPAPAPGPETGSRSFLEVPVNNQPDAGTGQPGEPDKAPEPPQPSGSLPEESLSTGEPETAGLEAGTGTPGEAGGAEPVPRSEGGPETPRTERVTADVKPEGQPAPEAGSPAPEIAGEEAEKRPGPDAKPGTGSQVVIPDTTGLSDEPAARGSISAENPPDLQILPGNEDIPAIPPGSEDAAAEPARDSAAGDAGIPPGTENTAVPDTIRHPIPPPAPRAGYGKTVTWAVVAVLIIALAGAGVFLFGFTTPGDQPPVMPTVTVPEIPVATPVPQLTTTSTPQGPIPSDTPVFPGPFLQDGVWIELNSTSNYIGRIGNPGDLQEISGTGDNFYRVLKSNYPVQVSVQKRDNSGAVLSAAVYRNGTLLSTKSVTKPMGSVEILIDPVTARAPGLAGNETTGGYAGNPVGRVENY